MGTTIEGMGPKAAQLGFTDFLSSSALMVLGTKHFSISESSGQEIAQRSNMSQAGQLSAGAWLIVLP